MSQTPDATPAARADRIRPLDALRGVRALLRDPDDTARVFDVIDALSGDNGRRLVARLGRTPEGLRLLAERPQVLAVLGDRERLLAMPPGSLGRCYAAFVEREQISASGLVDASAWDGSPEASDEDPEQRWLGERLRDTHDLWHVVTGYGRDLVGEASLLAFTWAQTGNRGIGFIVVVAYLRALRIATARRLMRDAWRRGRRAAWLPGQDWEALLLQPLAQVRAQLGLGEPPRYEPIRSPGAPLLAA